MGNRVARHTRAQVLCDCCLQGIPLALCATRWPLALPPIRALIEGKDDRIVQVNRAVRQLLGYEPAWLVGRSLRMLLDPPHTSIAERAWRQ